MERFVGLIGIVVIFLIVFGMSNNRKAINYKTVDNWIYINKFCLLYLYLKFL